MKSSSASCSSSASTPNYCNSLSARWFSFVKDRFVHFTLVVLRRFQIVPFLFLLFFFKIELRRLPWLEELIQPLIRFVFRIELFDLVFLEDEHSFFEFVLLMLGVLTLMDFWLLLRLLMSYWMICMVALSIKVNSCYF